MAIKNILCAYSGESARGAGLQHGLRLANHHGAWVTGIVRHGRPLISQRCAARLSQDMLSFFDR